jgi:hypothetical protein
MTDIESIQGPGGMTRRKTYPDIKSYAFFTAAGVASTFQLRIEYLA